MIKAKPPVPEPNPSGWYALLPPPPPANPLCGLQKADFAIVGAGFTGVAAALTIGLNFPDARVALLDAQRVGVGASGRNSGFVVDIGHFNSHLTVPQNVSLTRLQRMGQQRLLHWINTFQIDCEWDSCGRIHAASSARGVRMLEKFRAQLDSMNETYTVLDSSQAAALT